MARAKSKPRPEAVAVWEPSPEHRPRPDQLSLFDAGEPIVRPAVVTPVRPPSGPSLFDPDPVEDGR